MNTMQKSMLSLSAGNRSGVLAKVSALFSRRALNIQSLTVHPGLENGTSCITIIFTGETQSITQVTNQLEKLEDVLSVTLISPGDRITECMLALIQFSKDAKGFLPAENTITYRLEGNVLEVMGPSEAVEGYIAKHAPNITRLSKSIAIILHNQEVPHGKHLLRQGL